LSESGFSGNAKLLAFILVTISDFGIGLTRFF
jgi:hypothetical protein